MKHTDFLPVVDLVETLGAEIALWRADSAAREMIEREEYKTAADRRAHDWLREGLIRLFPTTPVLSEEDATHDERRPDAYWLIDPIDGTASWYEGFPGFATQAAYIEGQRSIFGIVHAPVLRKSWTAVLGDGARLNGEPLPRLVPSERLVIVDNYPDPRRAAKVLVERLPATGYTESGSLALQLRF